MFWVLWAIFKLWTSAFCACFDILPATPGPTPIAATNILHYSRHCQPGSEDLLWSYENFQNFTTNSPLCEIGRPQNSLGPCVVWTWLPLVIFLGGYTLLTSSQEVCSQQDESLLLKKKMPLGQLQTKLPKCSFDKKKTIHSIFHSVIWKHEMFSYCSKYSSVWNNILLEAIIQQCLICQIFLFFTFLFPFLCFRCNSIKNDIKQEMGSMWTTSIKESINYGEIFRNIT